MRSPAPLLLFPCSPTTTIHTDVCAYLCPKIIHTFNSCASFFYLLTDLIGIGVGIAGANAGLLTIHCDLYVLIIMWWTSWGGTDCVTLTSYLITNTAFVCRHTIEQHLSRTVDSDRKSFIVSHCFEFEFEFDVFCVEQKKICPRLREANQPLSCFGTISKIWCPPFRAPALTPPTPQNKSTTAALH